MAVVPMDTVRRMKLSEPDHYHGMVKMHLSFLLDLNTDECDCSFLEEGRLEKEKDTVDSKFKKAFTPIKKAKAMGVMDGVPLTQEGVCQVYQIIEYLGRPHNIVVEGLFRKHGNLKKQQALKERLNRGIALNLDDEEFTVHEAAAVLKMFLATLPEPLLTDAYYRAHCQVASLVKDGMAEGEREAAVEKQISCLQLLFQLIPAVNLALLKDLLLFLNAVTRKETENKMNSTNLGTLFSTHILCPRKLSPEVLKSNHQLLSKAVTFMIEQAEHLFNLPEKLKLDIQSYQARRSHIVCTPKAKRGRGSSSKQTTGIGTAPDSSPIVSTIFSFVDRPASLAATHGNETDHALAKLYAHVQGMPESAQKRRLVSKLNEANGKGTPDVATSGSVNTVGRNARHRRRSGDGILNLLTPRRKRTGVHGSYSVKEAHESKGEAVQPSNSFRRQNSLQPNTPVTSRTLSPSSHSSPAMLSPMTAERERLPSPALVTPADSLTSEVSPSVDEVDTPGKDSSLSSANSGDSVGSTSEGEELDGSYSSAPPLPPRTPAPSTTDFLSPLPGRPMDSLSPRIMRTITTPRSRGGLMVCSTTQLEKWNLILQSSLMDEDQDSSSMNGDEGDSDVSVFNTVSEYDSENLSSVSDRRVEETETSCLSNVLAADLVGERVRVKEGAYRSKSLSNQFKQYLSEQGMEILEESMQQSETDTPDTSYCEEVRRLLRGGEETLSTSMQAVLDGIEPGNGSVLSCSSKDSTVTLKNLLQEAEKDNSAPAGTTVVLQNLQDAERENAEPTGSSQGRRGVKRRSLTEAPPTPLQPANSIYFETDL